MTGGFGLGRTHTEFRFAELVEKVSESAERIIIRSDARALRSPVPLKSPPTGTQHLHHDVDRQPHKQPVHTGLVPRPDVGSVQHEPNRDVTA